MRLNKYLAHCGVDSRRNCDEIIFQGRVRVEGELVTHPGTQIDESASNVTVDGERVQSKKVFTYMKLHKPKGYVTSKRDPHNESTVMDLIPNVLDVVPVGRLDKDTTGTLIFTDDGELNFRLTHPKYGVEKEYEAILYREPEGSPETDMIKGIVLEDNGDFVRGKVSSLNKTRTHYKVVLQEGKKREVKRIFRHYNSQVKHLHRNSFAGVTANDIPMGKWKKLTLEEITQLKTVAGQIQK